MAYKIIDHGVFKSYTPNPLPDWAIDAGNVLGPVVFFQRESDGVDFYEWRKTNPFKENSIVAQTLANDSTEHETVKAVFRDTSMLSPYGQRIIEIQGVDPKENKPHNLFAWLNYDPDTNTLSGEAKPPQPPEMLPLTFKKDLWARTTVVEADKIEAWLDKQSSRDRRMFNDPILIIHTDPIYDTLLKAFTDLFGAKRAKIILERSN